MENEENEDHKEPDRIKSKKRREFDRDDGFGDWVNIYFFP